jgi:hypothetical protein
MSTMIRSTTTFAADDHTRSQALTARRQLNDVGYEGRLLFGNQNGAGQCSFLATSLLQRILDPQQGGPTCAPAVFRLDAVERFLDHRLEADGQRTRQIPCMLDCCSKRVNVGPPHFEKFDAFRLEPACTTERAQRTSFASWRVSRTVSVDNQIGPQDRLRLTARTAVVAQW